MSGSKSSEGARSIVSGSTTHLQLLDIKAITLYAGSGDVTLPAHEEMELLIIVKEGQLSVTLENESTTIGPGSVAMILPGDSYALNNTTSENTIYYALQYRSKAPVNVDRGRNAGGSFIIDWDQVAFNSHNKGGRRDFFHRATAMCEDFEMHVTNLNEGTSSHDPHTHEVEEIILMIKGDISMHIDGSESPATRGDLAFLDSNISHAPTNIGSGQCMYFAFQWK